ncbi:MAG: hypothetical protein HY904_22060 [Deltaproteobacteria bacterium]|nr:hypothetical protein [Deltaproteobacteria bacterium]
MFRVLRLHMLTAAVVTLAACTLLRVDECQADGDCAGGGTCDTDRGHCDPASSSSSSGGWSSSRGSSSAESRSSSDLCAAGQCASSSTSGVSSYNTHDGAKRVFITSLDHATSYGGLEGADRICQAAADAAALPGTWKAWLSSSTQSAADRLAHHRGRYETTTGVAIAGSWRSLTGGMLLAPIDRDEFGSQRNRAAFTNTNPDGTTRSTTQNCADWSMGGGGEVSFVGSSTAVDGEWTLQARSYSCAYAYALYCVEQ